MGPATASGARAPRLQPLNALRPLLIDVGHGTGSCFPATGMRGWHILQPPMFSLLHARPESVYFFTYIDAT